MYFMPLEALYYVDPKLCKISSILCTVPIPLNTEETDGFCSVFLVPRYSARQVQNAQSKVLHVWKLTWKPNRGPIKTTVPVEWDYMGFHVSLGECMCRL